MNRIADLTWKHPKLVLAAVGLFALLAIAVGRDVEQHLKAAGFTDSASESERASALLRDSLGYDPNPGLAVVVRAPDGGRLDLASPALRREVAELSREIRRVEYVGRVVNPLRDRRAASTLIARDGESLTIAVYLSTDDIQDAGGFAAEDVSALLADEPARHRDGRLCRRLRRDQRPDPRRPDQGRADRLPDPGAAAALRLPRRRRRRDPAAARGDLDRRHAVRAAGDVELRRHLAVRAQHRHRAQPRPRGRLRPAAGLALSRGDRRRAERPARRTAAPCRPPAAPRSSPASPSPPRWRR